MHKLGEPTALVKVRQADTMLVKEVMESARKQYAGGPCKQHMVGARTQYAVDACHEAGCRGCMLASQLQGQGMLWTAVAIGNAHVI